MGMDATATLFYGYCWNEETKLFLPQTEDEDDEEADEPEWSKVLLCSRGVKNPWDDYPRDEFGVLSYHARKAAEDRWIEEHRAELEAWWAAQKAVQHEFGVEVGRHGYCDDSKPYVYIFESEITTSYGEGISLARRSLEVPQWWDDRLARWMNALKVEYPQEHPQWWLVACYG